MATEAEAIVSDFCRAWARLNIDQIMDFFTEDAEYHNIPLPKATGKAAIRKTIEGLLKGTTWLEFKVLHSAAVGNVVLNERVDSFEVKGKRMSLPVAGVFETTPDGKIKAWRDYFDMKMFTDQMK
ncbi:MAG TPA: limonene-1,2-epoxide hydrolase family protein [Candidatus Binataceae bacterium]|jgi:limonene-1,2-epoxide hydrolase|nr:limonene-1,2-epoxide hydrolase family protein [Candidatus Binataceae bacterium]